MYASLMQCSCVTHGQPDVQILHPMPGPLNKATNVFHPQATQKKHDHDLIWCELTLCESAERGVLALQSI